MPVVACQSGPVVAQAHVDSLHVAQQTLTGLLDDTRLIKLEDHDLGADILYHFLDLLCSL